MAEGDKWTDSGLVFTTHNGTSLNPNNADHGRHIRSRFTLAA